ncbi:unnamed protein product, partial [Cyprideis torosa]
MLSRLFFIRALNFPFSCRLYSNMNPGEKLEKLRGLMKERNLQAYVIPSGDDHMSENPPLAFKRREFITGFTGSAGTALVTASKALLWTDGRYFVQADKELDKEHWTLMKDCNIIQN